MIKSIEVFFNKIDESEVDYDVINFLNIVEEHIKIKKINENLKYRDSENQYNKSATKNKIIKKILFTFQLNSENIKESWSEQRDNKNKTALKYIDDFVKEYLDKKYPITNCNNKLN